PWLMPFCNREAVAGQPAHVCFGSEADFGGNPLNVRFTPKSGHWDSARGMSALCQKRTLMGFAVRWRNVLDRNYAAFQALLDLCHSALWLVCRCLPVFERYFGSPC